MERAWDQPTCSHSYDHLEWRSPRLSSITLLISFYNVHSWISQRHWWWRDTATGCQASPSPPIHHDNAVFPGLRSRHWLDARWQKESGSGPWNPPGASSTLATVYLLDTKDATGQGREPGLKKSRLERWDQSSPDLCSGLSDEEEIMCSFTGLWAAEVAYHNIQPI